MSRALTILTTPKAFRGLFDVIQTNAITTWTKLTCRPEVILFGDDPGTGDLAGALGVRHVPDVRRTPEGTPLLSDMFLRGQELATSPVVCWSNADVIFTDRICAVAAMMAASDDPLYVVGRRTDIDLGTLLDFDGDWRRTVTTMAQAGGELKPYNWIDWFMFPTGLFTELPDFAIGRPGYDQWLIWNASRLGATVVDASDYVPAIHQRHDYSHVGSREAAFAGTEARRNQVLVEDWRRYHSIAHARRKLDTDGRLVPARGLVYRLARPRRRLAHALRFTVPLRRRLLGETATRRSRRPRPAR